MTELFVYTGDEVKPVYDLIDKLYRQISESVSEARKELSHLSCDCGEKTRLDTLDAEAWHTKNYDGSYEGHSWDVSYITVKCPKCSTSARFSIGPISIYDFKSIENKYDR